MVERVQLLNEELEEPLTIETEMGSVALFTRRAPGYDSTNEDSALLVHSERGVVLAVADGAGGCAEGEIASRLTIETLGRHLVQPEAELRVGVLDAFEEANAQVLGLGSGAATTLSVVQLAPGTGGLELRSFHAGDSSVVVTGGRGRVKLNTIPHSPVGYAVEAGWLDPEEALHHRDLNLVSNVVGLADMRIEMGSALALAVRDTVVVGTDGLFDNLHHWEIVSLVRKGPLREAAQRLVDLATSRMAVQNGSHPSKPDDLTFALFRPHRRVSSQKRRSAPPQPRPPVGAATAEAARLSA